MADPAQVSGTVQIGVALINSGPQIALTAIGLYVAYRILPLAIELARTRQLTVKIGGMEISIATAAENITKQLIELQERVAKLEVTDPAGKSRTLAAGAAELATAPKRILWVDDHPESNAFHIQKLTQDGHAVIIARSSSEGLERASSTKFDLVISDMGRPEGNQYAPDAGIRLLRSFRDAKMNVPFIFFTTRDAIARFGAEANKLGAVGLANESADLYRLIDQAFAPSH